MTNQHPARPKATLDQSAASHPRVSSWVTASAGTGKTQVLTDRVLRLLLAGARPGAILCLTFTRAATAVMKARVTTALAKWATAADDVLQEDIRRMRYGEAATAAELAKARRLFADVLDAPGGLRIVTIHAFCESLLARFPIESGVAPHFQVMDERTAAEHLEEARDHVLERARKDESLATRIGGVTARVNEQRFGELMAELAKQRARVGRLVDPDLEAGLARIRACLELEEGETADSVLAVACAEGAFDALGLEGACRELAKGAKTCIARGELIRSWLTAAVAERAARWPEYRHAYFQKSKPAEQYADLIAKKAADAMPHVERALRREAERIAAVVERLNKVEVYEATMCLLAFGVELLEEYRRGKLRHALLDYDDLILKTIDLLERDGVAPWVLYKLDGGIDHILIDEAQDTNPGQWRVIQAIAGEFFAGKGAYDERQDGAAPRTVFAVGDAKQSIYSFLQADPNAFQDMKDYFAQRVTAVEAEWKPQDLFNSFRSVESVLKAVDLVFAEGPARDGVVPLDQPAIRHVPSRRGQAGYVELWQEVREEDPPPALAWDPPREQQHRRSATAIVAERIARTVQAWIGTEFLPARGRTVRAEDIMILVQRRGTFVEEVIRALKTKNVPVAGTDRMLITEQLPVQDLMALGAFALLPGDSLNLAAVLKGPLVGLTEDALYDLAVDRTGSLWEVLRTRAAERLDFTAAHKFLSGILGRADYATPHAFYATLLATGGRRAILSRLGHEANDPIDEFLARALEYEQAHAPSLQGFLDWIGRGQVVVARDLEVGRDEVRVLTVHGAKGLQAPVVFLPDTFFIGQSEPLLYWREQDDTDVLLWMHLAKNADAVLTAARESAKRRREEEYHRLLYVAMTRAEDRLIVCGFAPKKPKSGESKREARTWYHLIADGLARMGPGVLHGPDVLRWVNAQTELPDGGNGEGAAPQGSPPLPEWARRAAPTEPAPKSPLTPSRPTGAEPPAYSPLTGAADNAGIRRGVLIHRLLQLLPQLPPNARAPAAQRFLAANAAEFSVPARAEMASATLAVIEEPSFAHLFGPNSRAEVPLVGAVRLGKDHEAVLAGQIDRLVVGERDVLIVDYKTHRPAPADLAGVPPIYRQQMAAYRAALAAIYPGHTIRCALLWTDGPRLMELPVAQLSNV